MTEISNNISAVRTTTDNTVQKAVNSENIQTSESVKEPVNSLKADTVEISGNKEKEKVNEKGLFANIKKSVQDGVMCGSYAYAAGGIANYIKDKITKTAATEGKTAKFPVGKLAIGIGMLSTAASLWTAKTKENITETARRRMRNFH